MRKSTMSTQVIGRSPASPASAAEAASERSAIVALLDGASLEISAHDAADIAECVSYLDPGTEVFISQPMGQPYHGAVAMAARLRRAGFRPVPHITARALASLSALEDYLARATGEAGVEHVLVIGGDRDRPAGPFDSSLSVLCTGALQRHGIRRLSVGAYPEGHPAISAKALTDALLAKRELARENGLQLQIVTQFSFDAKPIVSWTRQAAGLGIPVRVGLAGPASITTLLKFAARCGIGNSVRLLRSRSDSIIRLITEAGPEGVIRDLARSAGAGEAGFAGLHLFTFGGLLRSARWLRAVRSGNFHFVPGQPGFRAGTTD
jgi:methylenetetrahydrofolate reductase (NADPH)